MLDLISLAINTFDVVLDLPCMMLSKIDKMIITSIITFPLKLEFSSRWKHFLEGKIGLCWDLCKRTTRRQCIAWPLCQCTICPTSPFGDFEEAFYTRIFDCYSHIFGPTLKHLEAQYAMCCAIQ